MMSFKSHEEFGQVAAVSASNGGGAPVPWWAVSQLLSGEPAALSLPEVETRRDSQFQVVPRAQGILDPAPQPPVKAGMPVPKSGAPEVLKFSVFQGNLESGGKGEKISERSATIALQSPLPEYNSPFEFGLGQSMVSSNYPRADQCYGLLTTYTMKSMVVHVYQQWSVMWGNSYSRRRRPVAKEDTTEAVATPELVLAVPRTELYSVGTE